jgi:hypothetical protein
MNFEPKFVKNVKPPAYGGQGEEDHDDLKTFGKHTPLLALHLIWI